MSRRIGIAGAGSIAFGCAAFLMEAGHAVTLWSPSGKGTEALAAGAPLRAEGAVTAEVRPDVATSAAALAEGAEVILIALPLYGHRTVLDALAPHLRDGQTVVISSHGAFGALYLSDKLAARGLRLPIVAMGTTLLTGRRQGPDLVRVNTVRNRVDICTVPEDLRAEGEAVFADLAGDRGVPRDGLLAITLSNLNPQNHMGIALCNMTRMEHGEDWGQGANVTPNVGRLLEALDAERLAVAGALGLEVKTIFEHFHQSFHVPVGSISEMNQEMAQKGTGGTGPATADSRYVTEDVPYGLATTVAVARLAGVPVPLHAAGVTVFSALYGRDFAAENDLLTALDLGSMDIRALDTACRKGKVPSEEHAASD
ncbi:NAD/NADP octopine/nopaline dehydrogenase [Rhodobacteraceae bacterium CCMM004]|nr:NAD/NADP octopine/nopaline dehydrogenase [Rhodobacteraceae bacterium CCMM004]